MSEKQEADTTLFEDNGLWIGYHFNGQKYYFNDIGRESFVDATMDLYDMVHNGKE